MPSRRRVSPHGTMTARICLCECGETGSTFVSGHDGTGAGGAVTAARGSRLMRWARLRTTGVAAAVGLLFIATNVALIRRINPDPAIGGDASQYLALTRGDLDAVVTPFRFRVLVPFLASLLPVSPGHAFMVITYGSLLVLFVVLVLTAYRLCGDLLASLVATLVVFASRWFLYNFENPYLTDAFGLAATGVALAALIGSSTTLFVSSLVTGILARETLLPLSLAWTVTRRWRAAVLIVLVALLAYLAPRILVPQDVSLLEYFRTAISEHGPIAHPADFGAQVVFSWGYIAVLAAPGFLLIPRPHRSRVAFAAGLLACAALVSCLVAIDFGRMFEALGPVLALAGAAVLGELRARSPRAGAAILALLLVFAAVQCLAFVPNRLIEIPPPRAFRWGLECGGLLLTGLVLLAIRRPAATDAAD